MVLPFELRRALGLTKGDKVMIEAEGDNITLTTARLRRKRAQAIAKRYTQPGVSVVEEFLAEKRAEARQDEIVQRERRGVISKIASGPLDAVGDDMMLIRALVGRQRLGSGAQHVRLCFKAIRLTRRRLFERLFQAARSNRVLMKRTSPRIPGSATLQSPRRIIRITSNPFSVARAVDIVLKLPVGLIRCFSAP